MKITNDANKPSELGRAKASHGFKRASMCNGFYMTPQDYLVDIVKPNIAEFHEHYSDLRRAHNAIGAVDALAAHLFVWASANAPLTVASVNDDSHYRATLASRNRDFALIRDIAKALKHVQLTRYNPQVSRADQITSRPIGWGEGGWGEGRWGGVEQVVVEIVPGEISYVENIVDRAVAFLEAEMAALGI